MIDPDRVLRPLDEESAEIDRLTSYESPDQLAAALQAAWRAVERSLRNLIRADPQAPDELRLAAFSPKDLPSDRLIPALSRRNLVSLRLAGMTHELERSAERARTGAVRAADADAAVATITQLRGEVHALGDRPVRAVAHAAVESGALEESPSEVRAGGRGGVPLPLIAAAAALLLALIVTVVFALRDGPMEGAIAAFDRGQLGVAERGFQQVVADDPDNVTALLYLGRIQRRQGRYDEAADALRRAAESAPQDPHVRRELGYLFLDLERPQAAVQQFRRAQEIEPDNERNWIGLITALRAAHDPEADEVLRRAPAQVRAALTSGVLSPDTP